MIKGYSESGLEQYEHRFERLLIPAAIRCSSFTMSMRGSSYTRNIVGARSAPLTPTYLGLSSWQTCERERACVKLRASPAWTPQRRKVFNQDVSNILAGVTCWRECWGDLLLASLDLLRHLRITYGAAFAEQMAAALRAERDEGYKSLAEEHTTLIDAIMLAGEQLELPAIVTETF